MPTLKPASNKIDESWIACHECDLLIALPALASKQKARCPRCHYVVTVNRSNNNDKILAYALAALCFLVVALLLPFLTIEAQGQERNVSLLSMASSLFVQQYWVLASLVFVFIIAAPLVFLICICAVVFALKRQRAKMIHRHLLRALTSITPWSMVEIFIIGLLVSLVKIIAMADVQINLAFYSFVLFSICLTCVFLHVDKVQLWQQAKKYAD